MGRAAENERKKLKATYFNNLAVGLLIGGLLIPYLGIVTKLPALVNRLRSGEGFAFVELATGVGIFASMWLAYTAARTLRKRADRIAGTIEGD